MEFKERFKDLLDENEISAKKLGNLLGIDHSSIYFYLQGSLPNIENAVKLANYFKCTLNYLFCIDFYPDEYEVKTTYNSQVFFDRYNFLLETKNVSHYRVSKDLGFGNSSYKKWEQGSEPKLETLVKIAVYFNYNIDFFIDRAVEKEKLWLILWEYYKI